MKKILLFILMATTAFMLNTFSAQAHPADYKSNNRMIQSMTGVYQDEKTNLYYMLGDIYFALGDFPEDWDCTPAYPHIISYNERVEIDLSERYLCIDGYLYDLELIYGLRLNGDSSAYAITTEIFSNAKCGTLQGFLNTGSYYSWDTEPTATSTPMPEPVEEITVTDYSATMYAKKDCNVRANGSTSYSVIGKLKFNDEVQVTGRCSTGWYRISFNGGDGYVSDTLLTTTKYVAPEPEPEVTEEEPVVIDNHLFDDLNEEAIGVLNQLIGTEGYDATICVLATAEHKTVPKETLSLIRTSGKTVTIRFMADENTAEVTYTITNVLDEADLNLAYALSDDVFSAEDVILPYALDIAVATGLTGDVFIHVSDGDGVYTVWDTTTVEDGCITLKTNHLQKYTFSGEDLTPVEEPEMIEPEPNEEEDKPVVKPEPEEEAEEVEAPSATRTSGADPKVIFIIIGVGVIAAIVTVMVILRKKEE